MVDRLIMSKLKIVFDANPMINTKSGVGYYTHSLIEALSKVGDGELELVGHYFNFLGKRPNSGLPAAENIKYVQSRLIPGKALGLCRRLGFQPFFEIFTRQNSDITLFTNFAALPSLTSKLSVVAVHDLGFIDCPEYISTKNLAFLKKWAPRSLRKSEMVITISEFTKNRIIDVFDIDENKIHVTPIPPASHVPPDNSIIEKFGIQGDYILFVGTIEPRKNISNLLDAYSSLPAQIKDTYSLVLVGGKGWHDEQILDKLVTLKSLGNKIHQTGYVSDAERAAFYENSTVCVLPSYYEGFGMPVLEAMSYGKPVVCSNIEVFKEVAGDAAMYFNVNDVVALKDTLTKLLSSQQVMSKYKHLSLRHSEKFINWDTVAKDLIKSFRERLQ